jgi:hypothetical protein
VTATARSKVDAIVLVHSGICDARMWDGFDLPGATPHEMRGFGDNPHPIRLQHPADGSAR